MSIVITTHYHVIAVQDLGGSQEHWRGFDGQCRDHAEQFARDMINADRMPHERACAEFGDRAEELISDNVNPGWEAIFIERCSEPCQWSLDRWVPEYYARVRQEDSIPRPWWDPRREPAVLSDDAYALEEFYFGERNGENFPF